MDMYENPDEFGCNPNQPEGVVGFGHIHIGKITLLDRIFGNCEKGLHRFQQFLVSEQFPTRFKMGEAHIKGDVVGFVEALKTKRYAIRCTRCGKKLE